MQLRQLFGTPFPIHQSVFGGTFKHTFSKQLVIPHSGKLQCHRLIYVTNGALQVFLLLTYLYRGMYSSSTGIVPVVVVPVSHVVGQIVFYSQDDC